MPEIETNYTNITRHNCACCDVLVIIETPDADVSQRIWHTEYKDT